MATPETSLRRGSFLGRLLAFITFLLALGAAGLAVYTYSLYIHDRIARDDLTKRVAAWDGKFDAFKGAVREVDHHLTSVVYQEIELPGSGWQPVVGGFYVIDLAVTPQGKGVRVLGKVINPTSVTHENALFSLKIGDHRATFTLPKVPPAVAQPFDVALPDVVPAAATRAYVALDSSTISFSSSTTRKGPGAGPLDTDKLLK
ncbi:MAG TPA: hypothetical protein VH560_03175 [Polyangia bacterium]|nr:hypothetical protein [Polyangia bacterium]